MKYFFNNASGTKADIKRHCEKEKQLTTKISALESVENPTPFDMRALHIYRNMYRQLLLSKSEVVFKIGK